MPENFREHFLQFSHSLQLFAKEDTIILAISGGLDSVVLAHLLISLKQPLVLAHCNFQLRGEESHRDEHFVRNLAAEWNVPIYTETYDTQLFAQENKLSTQVAARQLRYGFFERLSIQLTKKGKKTWIATAHHANDAAETLLMNLFRGTGIDGLKGIPVKNGNIIRPMLFAGREQIETYARENGLTWVEDSSNAKEDYARNLVRHSVLPVIEKKYPAVIQNLWGTMEKMQEAAALYHQMVARRLKRMVVFEGGFQKVPVLKLEKATERNTLTWEWIKGFGFTEGQVGEVVKLFSSSTGSYISSPTHKIIRNRAWLVMSVIGRVNRAPIIIEQLPARENIPDELVVKIAHPEILDTAKKIPSLPENEAWVDFTNLQLPLILRPWKAGDYFYPLGMAKKKKVSRFLIDRKLSPQQKENVWVLESNKRIVWLVGLRIDDRFKITQQTKGVVRMKLMGAMSQ